jgi:hypothetical protein
MRLSTFGHQLVSFCSGYVELTENLYDLHAMLRNVLRLLHLPLVGVGSLCLLRRIDSEVPNR